MAQVLGFDFVAQIIPLQRSLIIRLIHLSLKLLKPHLLALYLRMDQKNLLKDQQMDQMSQQPSILL